MGLIELGRPNTLIALINQARLVLVLVVIVLIQFIEDVDVIDLQWAGIAVFVYALILSVFPFHRTRSRNLSFLISLLDTSFVILIVARTGEIASPFLALLFFPLINLAVLYETRGAIASLVLFLLYTFLTLETTDYPPPAILNLFVAMCLYSFFAVYLGDVCHQIKSERGGGGGEIRTREGPKSP